MTETNRIQEPTAGSPEWRLREMRDTVRLMEELCGCRKPSSLFHGVAHDFGRGYYVFTEEMPKFIWRINLFHKPTTLFPYNDVMHKWYLLNSLLVLRTSLHQ